jgi:hypothetical protein
MVVAEGGLPQELVPVLVPIAREEVIRHVISEARDRRRSAPVRRMAA